jgi:hypothetical protein
MHRRLVAWIGLLTLITAAAAVADLATGGRPDPPALRAASVRLDGPWRFHTGDDPAWSKPDFDDHAWESLVKKPAPGSHEGEL